MSDDADLAKKVVPGTVLASVLGLTDRRIRELRDDGHIPQHPDGGYELGATVRAYAQFLGSRAKPVRDTEHSRLARVQADRIDRENRRERGELLERETVDETLAGLFAAICPLLEGMGGRLANELSGLTDPAVIRERILDECRAARSAGADFLERRAAALEAVSDRGAAVAPAAEADALAVGGGEPGLPGRERGTGPISRAPDAVGDPAAGSMREPALLASGRRDGDADG